MLQLLMQFEYIAKELNTMNRNSSLMHSLHFSTLSIPFGVKNVFS